jgi:O-acetyl-ADP-ribose deacetylase (regulator of RNase III)
MSALSLSDYRQLVALDVPFATGPAARDAEEAASLVHRVVEYLSADPEVPRRELAGLPRADDDVAGQRRWLRAALTVRAAKPLPEAVHAWIDAILQHERRESQAIDAATLPPVSKTAPRTWFAPAESVALWQGDITHLDADAIVNAANTQMLGCFRPLHACIDNAIHSAAGPRLREDCARIMTAQSHDEPTGLAKITRGYHLPARFVLHTVGPIVRGRLTSAHALDLARCYRSCLDTAVEVEGVQTVAFCAISTGVFGFPKREAASVALRTVGEWMEARPNALSKVIFNVFTDDDRGVYERAFADA